jgi:outer membrane receptor protein involved in Fe transport
VEKYTKAVLDEGATQEILLDEELRNILIPSDPYIPVKPERIQSLEIGYKSLIENKIYLDGVFYLNTYKNFIGAYRVRKADGDIDSPDIPERIGARASLLSGSAENTFEMASNFREKITAYGVAAGIQYTFSKGYLTGFNWNWNKLDPKKQAANPDFYFAFNTPEHKFNLQFGNRNFMGNLGFNLVYRWQSSFRWESTFAIGDVKEAGTLDAQISYKFPSIKTILKVGGENILNRQYVMNYGGPEMGAIYYISLTFDEFLH